MILEALPRGSLGGPGGCDLVGEAVTESYCMIAQCANGQRTAASLKWECHQPARVEFSCLAPFSCCQESVGVGAKADVVSSRPGLTGHDLNRLQCVQANNTRGRFMVAHFEHRGLAAPLRRLHLYSTLPFTVVCFCEEAAAEIACMAGAR